MKTTTKIAVMILAISINSCQNREVPTPLVDSTNMQEIKTNQALPYDPIFVETVKTHYLELTNQNNENARTAASLSDIENETVLWSKSINFLQKVANRKGMTTPIARIADDKNIRKLSLVSFQYNEKIESFKLEVKRNNSAGESFSGIIKLYSLQNNLLQTDKFEKGKKISTTGARERSVEYHVVEYEYIDDFTGFQVSFYGGTSGSGGGNPNEYDQPGPSIASVGGANSDMTFVSFLNSIQIFPNSDEQAVMQKFPYVYRSLLASLQETGQLPTESRAFRLGIPDQQAYPRFTELVKGLATFVEQHERVKQALMRHTTLPWNELQVLLKWGAGPLIVIMDLRPAHGNNIYGHTTNPGFPESTIQIQDSFVRGLEVANLASTKEATAFLLAMSILHEAVHFGAYEAGRTEIRSRDEFGNDFEREVLDTTINKENAASLCIKFYKQN